MVVCSCVELALAVRLLKDVQSQTSILESLNDTGEIRTILGLYYTAKVLGVI